MPTPQDSWPKYITLDRAIEIDEATARLFGLHDKPVHEWGQARKVAIAYYTLVKRGF